MSESTSPKNARNANEVLGLLFSSQRQQVSESQATFAKRFLPDAKEPERTYINWEQGIHAPSPKTRSDVESAIGWKIGSIGRILSGKEPFLLLEEIQDLPPANRPVKRASELTDDELLTEMTRRFLNYSDLARRPDQSDLPNE